MRKSIIAVAVAAAAGIVGGYFVAPRYAEDRLVAAIDTVVVDAAPVMTIRHGKITADFFSGSAIVEGVSASWWNAGLQIDRVVLDGLVLGQIDPRHGRLKFQGVADRGLLNSLICWSAPRCAPEVFNDDTGDWASLRYDLQLDYDFEPEGRTLRVSNFTLTAPNWGDLKFTLDVTHLPGPMTLPQLPRDGAPPGPLALLDILLQRLPDLGPALIRGAALSYRDQGAINRVVEKLAQHSVMRNPLYPDPRYYVFAQQDRLKAALEGGKAAIRPWDAALLDLLLGKANIEISVAPKSPVPAARVPSLMNEKEAGETIAALDLKIATSGTRELGRLAFTPAQERVLRARPYIDAGETGIAKRDLRDKFAALLSFQEAVRIAPDEARALAGLKRAISTLIAMGQKQERLMHWVGPGGAIEIFQGLVARAPDDADAAAALAAVPQHLVDAAKANAGSGTVAGAENARLKLNAAAGLRADDPAVIAARHELAVQLLAAGDARMQAGAYLSAERVGALAFYRKALQLEPDFAAAKAAIAALAIRLNDRVAQQIAAGDGGEAAVGVAAIRAQWRDLPGLGALETRLAALLGPTSPRIVSVSLSSNVIAEDINADFSRKTGIAVRYDALDYETLERTLLWKGSGYDVVMNRALFIGWKSPTGLFRRLDKSKLPNLANLDPTIMQASTSFDPEHEYSVPYIWGPLGIAYNVDAIRKRMPDAPVDSWDLLLDPEVVSKFKDCGVYLRDSPGDMLVSALIYLGLDPHSDRPEDYAAVKETLSAVRSDVQYADWPATITGLVQGETCLAVIALDEFQVAQQRAKRTQTGVTLRYFVPKEGALIVTANLAIPADAPDPDAALGYINMLLDPAVAAANANYLHLPTSNQAAIDRKLIAAADLADPALYPPPDVMAKLAADRPMTPQLDRLRIETWEAVKTGAASAP